MTNSDSGDNGSINMVALVTVTTEVVTPVMTLSPGSAFPIRLLLIDPKTISPQHIQKRQFQHCILRPFVVVGVRMGWGWVEVLVKSPS